MISTKQSITELLQYAVSIAGFNIFGQRFEACTVFIWDNL